MQDKALALSGVEVAESEGEADGAQGELRGGIVMGFHFIPALGAAENLHLGLRGILSEDDVFLKRGDALVGEILFYEILVFVLGKDLAEQHGLLAEVARVVRRLACDHDVRVIEKIEVPNAEAEFHAVFEDAARFAAEMIPKRERKIHRNQLVRIASASHRRHHAIEILVADFADEFPGKVLIDADVGNWFGGHHDGIKAWAARIGNGDVAGCSRRSVSRLRAFEILFLNPRHERAELGAGLFDGVLFADLEEGVVLLVAAFVFIDPVLGELA